MGKLPPASSGPELGYRAKRPEDQTGDYDDVEAINPELQREFEKMMSSMIEAQNQVKHLSVAPERADEHAEAACDLSGPELGYRAKRPEDQTGDYDDVEAINPELQREFEKMMRSMIEE